MTQILTGKSPDGSQQHEFRTDISFRQVAGSRDTITSVEHTKSGKNPGEYVREQVSTAPGDRVFVERTSFNNDTSYQSGTVYNPELAAKVRGIGADLYVKGGSMKDSDVQAASSGLSAAVDQALKQKQTERNEQSNPSIKR